MFKRFTSPARQVLVLAQDEARALKHNYFGTEHILLGLLREEEGLAARVLESLDITVEEVRAQVVRIVGQGGEALASQVPFTPHAVKVLELAQDEALSLGHDHIRTEHILLGLVRENEGVAARILLDFDADAKKVRNEIIRWLMHSAGETPMRKRAMRREVPIGQRLSDGTWGVAVMIWKHGLVIHSMRLEPWPLAADRSVHGWRVTDDLGTDYAQVGGRGSGSPERGFHYETDFAPAPPAAASTLQISHEAANNVLSVSLTD